MRICKIAAFKHPIQVVQIQRGGKWLMLHFPNKIMYDIPEMETVRFWSPFVYALPEEID